MIAPRGKFGGGSVPDAFGASRLAASKIRLTGVSAGSRVRGAPLALAYLAHSGFRVPAAPVDS
jgi:hypothetical protein